MIDLDGDRLLDLFGVLLVVAIVGTLALLGLGAAPAQNETTAAPDSDWTLSRINESHVRLLHDGGEAVRAEHLSVAVDGQHRRVRWSAEVLLDGEHGVVRAEEGTIVTLLWQRTEGERRVLERWTL